MLLLFSKKAFGGWGVFWGEKFLSFGGDSLKVSSDFIYLRRNDLGEFVVSFCFREGWILNVFNWDAFLTWESLNLCIF